MVARSTSATANWGARQVFLSAEAQAILERQPRASSPYVFPSPPDPAKPRGKIRDFRHCIRRQAGIDDVCLHDLHHRFAIHAAIQGLLLPVDPRLLGHSNMRITLRYARVRDREIVAVAECVGIEIASLCGSSGAEVRVGLRANLMRRLLGS